jgi:hypothetical protein
MGNPVVDVNGNNLADVTGGGSSYVRVHARAALRLGFEPHIFCPAPRDGVLETDFGVVHLVASPFRPFGALMVARNVPALGRGTDRDRHSICRRGRCASAAPGGNVTVEWLIVEEQIHRVCLTFHIAL